jgi:outer membrane protein OmpA-like peptidoglycan-associated protein
MFATQQTDHKNQRSGSIPDRTRSAAGEKGAPTFNSVWHSLSLGGLHAQAKLAVSAPQDPSEQEADLVADQVMRMSAQRVQRKCEACTQAAPTKDEEKEGAGAVRLKAEGESGINAVSAGLSGALGLGRPLSSGARQFFEPRLGRDLGGVRVHDDSGAARMATALNAQAFTLGHHIAFAPHKYSPDTFTGKQLLAHELAHVLQRAGPVIRRSVVPAIDVPSGQPQGERATEVSSEPPGAGTPAPHRPPALVKPEACPPPTSLSCTPTSTTPTSVMKTLLFAHNSATLSTTQRKEMDLAAAHWRTAGGSMIVRIDGYASAEGPCEYNWELSCRRARAVSSALQTPSDGSPGVPSGSINPFGHGESNAFGPTLSPNRRATISLPTPPPPPPPPAPTCLLPVFLGSGRGCASGTDFTHFDFPSISVLSQVKLAAWAAAHPGALSRWLVTDTECELEMDGALLALAGSAGHAAYSHFASGAGGTVTHGPTSILGAMALVSPEFLRTVATVQRAIETQLAAQAPSGALDPCALSVAPPPTFFASRHLYYPGALKSVIGGTQGETLFATAFSGSIPTRTYMITLRFLICDDFGVDESDLYAPGLFAFWVLQHERSATRYSPFVNELDLPITVTGTF